MARIPFANEKKEKRGEGIYPCFQGKAEMSSEHCSQLTLLERNNKIII